MKFMHSKNHFRIPTGYFYLEHPIPHMMTTQRRTDLTLGSRILLMPPNLTLIFRQRLDKTCGLVLFTFLVCTHWVARPKQMSATLFTSAADISHAWCLLCVKKWLVTENCKQILTVSVSQGSAMASMLACCPCIEVGQNN